MSINLLVQKIYGTDLDLDVVGVVVVMRC